MGKPASTYAAELPRLLETRSVGLRRVRQHLHYLGRWQAFLRHHWSLALPDEPPDHVALAPGLPIPKAILESRWLDRIASES